MTENSPNNNNYPLVIRVTDPRLLPTPAWGGRAGASLAETLERYQEKYSGSMPERVYFFNGIFFVELQK